MSTLGNQDALSSILLIWGMCFLLFFLVCFFPAVKVNMATAELYISSCILFQESFKPPPVYVLNVSVCSDQNLLSLFQCFAKSEQQIAVGCVQAPPHNAFTSAINR